jgi:hypothetical protein
VGEGARGDGIGRPDRGFCRLKKGQGGRCFRQRATACCGVLLAHLRAAAWSGAEGESEGGGGWCPVTTPRSGPERPKGQRGMDVGGVQSSRGKLVPLPWTASLQDSFSFTFA